MANQRDIDLSANNIAGLVDKAKAELIASLYLIGEEIGDITEFANTLLSIDVEGTLKNKLQKATSIYANAHRGVLESTIGFADINPRALSTFAALNEQLFDNSIIRTISGSIRTEVVKGLQAGLSTTQILENVTNASISNSQMQTLVNTSLNSYSRQVTNQMMDIAPGSTKYVYIGPVDEKTRDECLQMASAGALTLEEIKSRFGDGVLLDGGGFNCRHKWEIASSEGLGFNEQSKAEGRLENA
tara:strand:- start:1895 stop:2626 length:732 start_codon:yes stop_codon:yes gene_type:complete